MFEPIKALLRSDEAPPRTLLTKAAFRSFASQNWLRARWRGGFANESKCVYLTKKKKGQERSAALGEVAMVIAYMPYTPTTDTETHTPYTTPCISVITYYASDWPPDTALCLTVSHITRISVCQTAACLPPGTQSICAGRGAEKEQKHL